ncbi:WecB/TagA/CpsF family glycosyltransferase [Aureimonas psammosilenae]|uniref:WecB/TagA/CpsF family glycosyltransferase n=1 Tax=Aureimonas psammosilenae TaxID=2495496 RepID=UPI00126098D2|nr:WecB/TagA/CpsF family glycosyltransferase [Aureimonas psammosilenae]
MADEHFRQVRDERQMNSGEKDILGIAITDKTQEEALHLLDGFIEKRQAAGIAFANANLLNLAYRSDSLRQSLKRLVIFNDGIGVDIASRLLYRSRFKTNMNGTDFVPFFVANSRHPLRIFLFGGRPEIIEKAAGAFGAMSPKNTICGFHHGYVASGGEEALLAQIQEARPDVVLVALGNPLQELWIARNLDRLAPALLIGVGALFDFASGTVPRAPEWVRNLRAEWMYRLAIEPKRLMKRYVIGNATFLARVGRQRFKR